MSLATQEERSYSPLLNKKEVADFYSVNVRTIDRWLKNGTLPSEAKIVIGGSVRFRTSVLIARLTADSSTLTEGTK